MRLAKGVMLQLRLKTTPRGSVLESAQAPMSPEEARAFWREVADHAHRMALEDVTEAPVEQALPVVLPPEGGLLQSLKLSEVAGLVVDV